MASRKGLELQNTICERYGKKVNSDEIKLEGLHGKKLRICLMRGGKQIILCRDGRWQDLPGTEIYSPLVGKPKK